MEQMEILFLISVHCSGEFFGVFPSSREFFLLLSGDLFFLSQLGVFSSLLVGVFSRWGFFSWWRGVFLSGEFFSFLFVGVFSQWGVEWGEAAAAIGQKKVHQACPPSAAVQH